MWTSAAWEPLATLKFLTLAKICECVKYVLGNKQHFNERMIKETLPSDFMQQVHKLLKANTTGGTNRDIYYITNETIQEYFDTDLLKATFLCQMRSRISRECGLEREPRGKKEQKLHDECGLKFWGGSTKTFLNTHLAHILQCKSKYTFPAPIISAEEIFSHSRYFFRTRIFFSETDVQTILDDVDVVDVVAVAVALLVLLLTDVVVVFLDVVVVQY